MKMKGKKKKKKEEDTFITLGWILDPSVLRVSDGYYI